MMRTNPSSSRSSVNGLATNGFTTPQIRQQDISQATEITAVLERYPVEKRIFASQLDRAMEELVRGFNSIPLEPLLARQGAFCFASPADHDDWIYFTGAFLDLRSKYSAIATMSSSVAPFSDAPPAYNSQAPPRDEKDPLLSLDPLSTKIARLLSTRPAFDATQSHFLLLQHAQSSPGFTWTPTDFAPARGISISGVVMKSVAAQMTEMCGWYKARVPLAESVYRLVSPSPSFSIGVVEGVKMEKPIDCASQSGWMLQMGTLTATLELVRGILQSTTRGEVREERTRLALGHLTSLEINWVGTFMSENPADRGRNRRIRLANELVSLRLALLQGLRGGDEPRVDMLHI